MKVQIPCLAGILYSEVMSIYETVQSLEERRNVLSRTIIAIWTVLTRTCLLPTLTLQTH